MITAMRTPLRDAFRLAESYHNPGLAFERCLPVAGENAHDSSAALFAAISESSATGMYQVAFRRWTSLARASGMVLVSMELTGPMVVGIGNDTGLEVGITTNRTYGMPVIPGSAVKGLCHRTARLEAGLDATVLTALFGDTKHAACCTWHDAWYDPDSANGKPFQADTITVHHPAYYQSAGKKGWPTDFDDPTPVPFLSVRAGTRFTFAIEMHAEDGVKDSWDTLAHDFLVWCLGYRGIGAKTNAGYGRFRPVGVGAPGQAGGVVAGAAQPSGLATNDETWTNVNVTFRPGQGEVIATGPGNKKAIATVKAGLTGLECDPSIRDTLLAKKPAIGVVATVRVQGNRIQLLKLAKP